MAPTADTAPPRLRHGAAAGESKAPAEREQKAGCPQTRSPTAARRNEGSPGPKAPRLYTALQTRNRLQLRGRRGGGSQQTGAAAGRGGAPLGHGPVPRGAANHPPPRRRDLPSPASCRAAPGRAWLRGPLRPHGRVPGVQRKPPQPLASSGREQLGAKLPPVLQLPGSGSGGRKRGEANGEASRRRAPPSANRPPFSFNPETGKLKKEEPAAHGVAKTARNDTEKGVKGVWVAVTLKFPDAGAVRKPPCFSR